MDPRDAMEPDQLEMLSRIFAEQLSACLEECSHGRNGLFNRAKRVTGPRMNR